MNWIVHLMGVLIGLVIVGAIAARVLIPVLRDLDQHKREADRPEPAPGKPVHVQSAAPAVVQAPQAAATPQEDRFCHLALAGKALSREQLRRSLEFQAQKRDQGSIIRLWDCTVLLGLLDQQVAEDLQEQAGELDADTVGDFSIVRKVGAGAMGTVWLALAPDGRSVAVKVLSPQLAKVRPSLTRFLREAQAAIKLRHPNLVQGIALGEDQGRFFYAMEFVAGKDVRALIAERGAFPVDEGARIILQVTEALIAAHEQGIIHRDIKPSNIMVTADGVAKLADLGLVRYSEGDLTALTASGVGMGTADYAAPEQILDARRADARSDVYSLGATWYHMVTGRPPFTGVTPFEVCQKHLHEPLVPARLVRPDVPEAVSRIIERMMAKEPGGRFQTARELADAIGRECLREPTGA